MGQLSWFLGIEFVINKDCIMMKQTSYMRTILKKFNMENCKPVSTPFEEMSNDSKSKSISTTLYKCAVGSLIYCMICTRPDLSWVVTKLSQYNQPTENQWKAVKRVLRYLQSTTDLGLTFRKSEKLVLTGYCDASWAPDDDNRRSVTGYCFTLNRRVSRGGPKGPGPPPLEIEKQKKKKKRSSEQILSYFTYILLIF